MTENKKADEPDLSLLASDYMDLWQKQLSGMASDETVAALMAQTAQLMSNGVATVAAMTQATAPQAESTKGQDGTVDDGNSDDTSGEGDTRPASASAPSGMDDHVVDQLTERLERLEKRIDTLECGAVKAGS